MKNFIKPHLMQISPYLPGKPIEEVKRELGLRNVVKLASNENPYGPSSKVLKAVRKEAAAVNRYPDGGCFYLRQALSKRLKVLPGQLVFGNGSDEIIVMALRVFVSKGDEVIIAKPTFMMYPIAARLLEARIKEVPLNDFRYDLDRMISSVTRRTRMVIIGNPDNPAGTYVTQTDIKRLLARVPQNVLVFMDEAYFEYAVHNKDYPDTIGLLRKHKNLVISRTFSKMYGLAGLRVGYGIADQLVVSVFERVRDPFNVNSLAQAAAVACLKDGRYYRRIARIIEQQRQYLYRQLSGMRVPFVRTATNFIPIDAGDNSSVMARRLLEKGIIVRDMAAWGLKRYIRVSIGRPAENRKFIRVFRSMAASGNVSKNSQVKGRGETR